MKQFKNKIKLLEEVARLDLIDLEKNVGFINEDEKEKTRKTIIETSDRLIYWNSVKKRFQIDGIGYYCKVKDSCLGYFNQEEI